MNIKRAKQEIKDTVAAYLAKDEFGAYEIPSIRQRPMLLIGPPGIGKTQIMEQVRRSARLAWWLIPSPITQDRARWDCLLLSIKYMAARSMP